MLSILNRSLKYYFKGLMDLNGLKTLSLNMNSNLYFKLIAACKRAFFIQYVKYG